MDVFATIAEQKILEAIRRGELDNLPLKGRPIPPDESAAVPAKWRPSYKILKNAGFLPQELQFNREVLALSDLLAGCQEESERQQIGRRLNEKMLNYNILMERNARRPAFQHYAGKVR